MKFKTVYFEPESLDYFLGQKLKQVYSNIPWIPIENHNRILEMTQKENKEFPKMKQYLIIGTRKTHKYVENHKISDYLVPFTSSGCTAMCMYCYLVCNYNKCSYLRIFVNREQMLEKLIKTSLKSEKPLTFEVGSNSDLILENTITQNLQWLIPEFAKQGRGKITFPTKFDMVEPLLNLDHKGKTIFRMSVNPEELIQKVEFGTSNLDKRIEAINKMCEAGYPTGILIAPVILTENWQSLYKSLIYKLSETLSEKVKHQLNIEIILMTYSFIHKAINQDAFPNAMNLYDKTKMTGRGRGRYCYNLTERTAAEELLKQEIKNYLPDSQIIYTS